MPIAQQKFYALNPNGSIDYYLPTSAMSNQYLEAMSSHSAYWGNQNVIRFILTQLFWEQSGELRSTVEKLLKADEEDSGGQ